MILFQSPLSNNGSLVWPNVVFEYRRNTGIPVLARPNIEIPVLEKPYGIAIPSACASFYNKIEPVTYPLYFTVTTWALSALIVSTFLISFFPTFPTSQNISQLLLILENRKFWKVEEVGSVEIVGSVRQVAEVENVWTENSSGGKVVKFVVFEKV